MRIRHRTAVLGAVVLSVLSARQAWAHWCDDLWASSYNLTVRPDSDASPKEVYVQNNMGYQLTNFKLTATTSSGAVTLTAPTKLKVAGTLLPGEKGTWKISGGSPAKIEDVTFSVSFGDSGQSHYYPTSGAKAVMIVKTDGSLAPAPPAPGITNSAGSSGNSQSRSIEFQALADWDDVDVGMDKLLNLYCAGRASWGSTDGVTQANCKDNKSTSCPSTKPTSGTGSKFDYVHLWAAGALAVRKSALGDRLAVFRERLKCAVNDGDTGFGGFPLFILGYLGNDEGAKSFAQTQASAGGDMGTIAKAALYMMGDTTQKSAVQSGVQSSSVFVKVACAAALGIVDNDDASVNSALIPEVKWIEPDTSDDGKGMFAAHVLELVAFARRGWVHQGVGTGAVSFYGETGGGSNGGAPGTGGARGTGGVAGTGGAVGAGGSTGNRDASPSDGRPPVAGTSGVGGTSGTAGAPGNGGTTAVVTGKGGAGAGGTGPGVAGSSGAGGSLGAGGIGRGSGGATVAGMGGGPGAGGETGGGGSVAPLAGVPGGSGGSTGAGSSSQGGGGASSPTTDPNGDTSSGLKCNLGGSARFSALSLVALAGLMLVAARRRRR
jgi:hypothetical protein